MIEAIDPITIGLACLIALAAVSYCALTHTLRKMENRK